MFKCHPAIKELQALIKNEDNYLGNIDASKITGMPTLFAGSTKSLLIPLKNGMFLKLKIWKQCFAMQL